MRNKIRQEILDETPKEVDVSVRKYADFVKRMNQILKTEGKS